MIQPQTDAKPSPLPSEWLHVAHRKAVHYWLAPEYLKEAKLAEWQNHMAKKQTTRNSTRKPTPRQVYAVTHQVLLRIEKLEQRVAELERLILPPEPHVKR